MNELVSDFSTHPLVPGALLASIMGDPQSRRGQPLDNAALLTCNKLPTLDIVSRFQNLGILAEEQASEIIAADNQYVTSFRELCRRIPEVPHGALVLSEGGCRARVLGTDEPISVVQVGKTEVRYHLRGLDDLHAMLKRHGDWILLGSADEQKPAAEGTVEAWARSPKNPVGGWYGLKKGLRGRFGMYVPPVMEALGLAELEHQPRNNRMRAR